MSVEEQILILQVEDLLIGPKMEKYQTSDLNNFRENLFEEKIS